jgi:DNA-directed RNA polymerase subunit RPC12/RpoP
MNRWRLRLLNLFSKNYHCHSCGCAFPKASAAISGMEGSTGLGRHVHCPHCQTVVEAWI